MKQQSIRIDHIPAILWGELSGRLMIAVHGDQSNKEDTVIAVLAEVAAAKGYQVLSFDLPEHGERKNSPELCKAQTCVGELQAVMRYARSLTGDISLFGCSLGAYFGLMTYQNESLRQALFLSPVVDMQGLIENMMGWFGVTEERLKAEREIQTPIGKTLYWDYYSYVRENPVDRWDVSTAVLWGEKDELSERDRVEAFYQRFGCSLTVMPSGEHFFHSEEQLVFYRAWLKEFLIPSSDISGMMRGN